MAEEEKKEVAAVEEQQSQEGMTKQSKGALTAFILSVVGLFFCWSPAGIVAIVLGIVSLATGKKNNPETQQQPFKVFGRIAKPVGIVDIVAGAIASLVWLIVLIVWAVGLAVAAVNA